MLKRSPLAVAGRHIAQPDVGKRVGVFGVKPVGVAEPWRERQVPRVRMTRVGIYIRHSINTVLDWQAPWRSGHNLRDNPPAYPYN